MPIISGFIMPMPMLAPEGGPVQSIRRSDPQGGRKVKLLSRLSTGACPVQNICSTEGLHVILQRVFLLCAYITMCAPGFKHCVPCMFGMPGGRPPNP